MPEIELKPWYAVAVPHEDIREGRLEEAIFAANIWAVKEGSAPEVYRDPAEFFRKTYLTEGLVKVIRRVGKALKGKGESGDRILSLQTSFGGGKTHTLVALWHLAKHSRTLEKSEAAADLRAALGDDLPERVKGIAVFTNASCDVTQGRRTDDGVHVRTLWGDIAYQLGGKTLYEKIRPNDEARTVPQGIFVEILQAASPCLILLDELADYCVGAAGVSVGGATLADQTISFIQQLTEAVQQVPGAVLVATLPASKEEVAQSVQGQEVFTTLEKRFQRLGADVKPVSDSEIFDVIRTRLFDTIASGKNKGVPALVAQTYSELYQAHINETPSEATKAAYRELIERSYPFHPTLIQTLYTRWGSHPDFQRTRGVLRLLASVVGDLWEKRKGNTQTQHLIQPCHIRWSIDAMQAALTRLWGANYQSVIAEDILGDHSNSRAFDDERGGDYERESIGQGLAAAILLGSFGGQGERAGYTTKELKLACARQGLNWNYLDGALLEMEERCFYQRTATAASAGKRYWFGTRPNLNKLVVQNRQLLADQKFNDEILGMVREATARSVGEGASWRIVIDPGQELPEQKSLALVVLGLAFAWDTGSGQADVVKAVESISQRCGERDRMYRNTLLFLAPVAKGLSRIRQSLREKFALETIRKEFGEQLDVEQLTDLKTRLSDAELKARESLAGCFSVVLRVHKQETQNAAIDGSRGSFTDHLGQLWKHVVEEEEWILRRVGSVTLERNGLMITEGQMRVKEATDAFLRFTDKPMISDRRAVTTGLEQACRDGLIGIARGASPSSVQAKYCGKAISLDPDEEGVWIIPKFKEEAPAPQSGTAATTGGTVVIDDAPPVPAGGTAATTTAPPTGRRIKRLHIHGDVSAEQWSDVFSSFVRPATIMKGKAAIQRARFGIDFTLDGTGDGINADDPAVKAMLESARQMGVEIEED